MSFDDLPNELKSLLLSQQQQIARLSEMLNGLAEAVLAATNLSGKVHEYAVGQSVAFQVFAELVVSTSPELKNHVAAALGQLIARPDVVPNEHCRAAIEQLHKAISEPSKTT